MTIQKFSITGMHCASCAMNIDCDLEDISGVIHVQTSYPKAETTIEYDEKSLDPDKIIKTIQTTGYGAKIV